ncbi:Zn-finger protein [Rhizoctonia solani]|uniref:Zn-finger protein n=1 Tax=Rhizoctonia solani TaxID=456999 RepID=A0A8H7I9U1_9AGAM|nr:Zn-finger protein [Rhizoctonia solani]
MKHIIGTHVLDNWLLAMPQAEGLTHFAKGITPVSQWTGQQSKQLLAQFLPAVIGGLNPPELGEMFNGMGPWAMEDNLKTFHELKELLVLKGFYKSKRRFNQIPKLHMLQHWVQSIRKLGTPDGYNTEAPEHLHIEYAKVPWRASNKVKPLEQMVIYIQRQDAIRMHQRYLEQYLGMDQGEGKSPDGSEYDKRQTELEQVEALAEHAFGTQSARFGSTTSLGVEKTCGQGNDNTNGRTSLNKLFTHRDVVRASAPEVSPSGRVRRAGVWDVALYVEKPTACPTTTGSFSDTNEKHGIHRYRAGRVRALFTLPAHLRFYYSGELAYLELFESFDVSASPFTKLYSTRPDFDSKGLRQTLVIPVTDIVFATHLVPKFHTIENQLELNRYVDLLDTRGNFWLNHYYNHHFYQYIQYWRRHRPRLQDRLLANLQRSRFPRLAGERESQEDSSDSSVTSQRWDPSASRQPEHQLDYERADKTARTFGLQ